MGNTGINFLSKYTFYVIYTFKEDKYSDIYDPNVQSGGVLRQPEMVYFFLFIFIFFSYFKPVFYRVYFLHRDCRGARIPVLNYFLKLYDMNFSQEYLATIIF